MPKSQDVKLCISEVWNIQLFRIQPLLPTE